MKTNSKFILEIAAFFALVILLIIGSTEVEASDSRMYNVVVVIDDSIAVIDTDPLSGDDCLLLANSILKGAQKSGENPAINCVGRSGSKEVFDALLFQLKLEAVLQE